MALITALIFAWGLVGYPSALAAAGALALALRGTALPG